LCPCCDCLVAPSNSGKAARGSTTLSHMITVYDTPEYQYPAEPLENGSFPQFQTPTVLIIHVICDSYDPHRVGDRHPTVQRASSARPPRRICPRLLTCTFLCVCAHGSNGARPHSGPGQHPLPATIAWLRWHLFLVEGFSFRVEGLPLRGLSSAWHESLDPEGLARL